MEKFIGTIVTWGLILVSLGVIKPVVGWLAVEAAKSSQTGLVSLGAYNRMLISGGRTQTSPRRHGRSHESR